MLRHYALVDLDTQVVDKESIRSILIAYVNTKAR